MKGMTYYTLFAEAIGPVLFFIPVLTHFFRLLGISFLFTLQMGIASAIHVGLFPYISVMASLVFVPSKFWNSPISSLLGSNSKKTSTGIENKEMDSESILTEDSNTFAKPGRGFVNVFALVALVYIFIWNLNVLGVTNNYWLNSQEYKSVGYALHLDQNWTMFSPYPPKDNGWFVIKGVLVGGNKVDLMANGGPAPVQNYEYPDAAKPDDVSSNVKNQRWRKYLLNLRKSEHAQFRDDYASYLCRHWNSVREDDDRLSHLQMYYIVERIKADFETSARSKRVLGEFSCDEKGPRFNKPREKSNSNKKEIEESHNYFKKGHAGNLYPGHPDLR
jgi:hypothetical protein